jgi:hypothetical protein
VHTINIVLMVFVHATLVSLAKIATSRHAPMTASATDTASMGRAIAALVGLVMIVPRRCAPMTALAMANASTPLAFASHPSPDSIAHY